MDSELDYAILSADIDKVKGLLKPGMRLFGEIGDKALAMAALSRSMPVLEYVHGCCTKDVDSSHAFAYALNQGFSDGVVYLYENGALEDARGWMKQSREFKRYMMRYLLMKGRLFVDVGTDFFGYILRVYSLENMLGARYIELADSRMRCDALSALADAGAIDEFMYKEYAARAIVFDECAMIDALDAHGGFDFAETFSGEPMNIKNHWVNPEMSARKVELVASAMPRDYSFPLDARYLEDTQALCAIIPRSSAQTCKRPDLIVAHLIAHRCNAELSMMKDWGGITAENVDEFLKLAHSCGNTQAVALLLEFKKHASASDPFAGLSGDLL